MSATNQTLVQLYCVIEGRNRIITQEVTVTEKRNRMAMGPFELDWFPEHGCYGIEFNTLRMTQVWDIIRNNKKKLLGHCKNLLPAYAITEFQLVDENEQVLARKSADARIDINLPRSIYIWPDITPEFLNHF